jgi:hypothetical protein
MRICLHILNLQTSNGLISTDEAVEKIQKIYLLPADDKPATKAYIYRHFRRGLGFRYCEKKNLKAKPKSLYKFENTFFKF